MAVIKQMDIAKMSEAERKDTLMEAKILEKLKHPNIICFKEVYKTKKGKLCIVMDYADGGDLAQKITSRKGKEYFKENQVLDYFVQICLAMKHIHDRKVLHRDLKSQNIFLTKGNMVKLGDFGIAKMLTATNQMVKTMVGTPYYLSPEIVEGKKYSFKSDIWSMGILLYELCTLKPPFDAHSLQYLALKIVNGKYAPIPTQYSKELRTFISQLLNRDPEKRPRVNDILNMPLIKNRIRDFLTKTQQSMEFNHTIIHKKDLNQIYIEQQKSQGRESERSLLDDDRDEESMSISTSSSSSRQKDDKDKKSIDRTDKTDKEDSKINSNLINIKRDAEERKKLEKEKLEKLEKERLEKERQDRERIEKLEKEKLEKERNLEKLYEDRRKDIQTQRDKIVSKISEKKKPISIVNPNANRPTSSKNNDKPLTERNSRNVFNNFRSKDKEDSYASNTTANGTNGSNSTRNSVAQSNISNSNSRDPIKDKESNTDRIKKIDSKLEQLRVERENRKRELEEKKTKREEERNRFLNEVKNKSLNKKAKPEVEVYWSERNPINTNPIQNSSQMEEFDEFEEIKMVDIPKKIEFKHEVHIDDEDDEDLPGGIKETEVNQEDLNAMNECMMNVYLDEYDTVAEDKKTKDKYSESVNKIEEVEEDQGEEEEEDEQNQCNPELLKKIEKRDSGRVMDTNSKSNTNNFTGDIKQFYMFLEERLGTKNLQLIREIIKRYNDDEDEPRFKREVENILDGPSRLSYMPLVHALVNMEEMIKYRKSR